MKKSSLMLFGLFAPSLVLAVWRIQVSVAIAALSAIAYVCAPTAIVLPQCAVALAGIIIVTAMSGINAGQNAGTTGGTTVRRSLVPISHFLPNGTTHDYLNTGALEVGKWHTVQAGEHTLRASKHADGFNMLRGSLNGAGRLIKRQDPNAIEDISVQFGDRQWPVKNQWTQEEINNMATNVLRTENLNAVSMCSTISDDTDPDRFDMSWIFETLNRPYTEIPPPCGA